MKWLPQRFNDSLALIIVVAIIGVWIGVGTGALSRLTDVIVGATISNFGAIVLYYYRKRESNTTEVPHG